MRSRKHYEEDEKTFSAPAYSVKGWGAGIAWHVRGWETEPDENTDWTGYEVRTGRVICTMVGDNEHHRIDPGDLTPINREDYCGECGQIGCGHDGMEREAS
jgi:hypothetical protein